VRLPAVRERLVALRDSTVLTDTSRVEDLGTLDCRVRRAWRADTLLRAPSGAPLAVRITPRRGGTLTLVADGGLFTNRALRETAAGEFSLALLRGGPRRIVVDEYHHGFGASGSMTAALWDWSTRSPWGWALWQALLIGVVALLAATVRSGPVHELPGRARRSPLEHVRALARTLAASRGHDVAVSILARGLRRRLSADGRPSRDDPRPWLAALGARVRTPAARRSAARLLDLTRPGRGADEVLAAAHAVEELWQELRP
jgi:hypothetical protein